MNRFCNPHIVSAFGTAVLCFALLCYPQTAVQGFYSGLQLCSASLLPVLFPFFVVCALLQNLPLSQKVFLPISKMLGFQSGYAVQTLLLSWLGGYAVCAQRVALMRKSNQLSEREAELLLMLGCCASPGFVIGSVGSLLMGSPVLGAILYFMQIAAGFIAAALCSPFLPESHNKAASAKRQNTYQVSLSDAISCAIDSSLNVCGCVIFFRIISTLMCNLLGQQPAISAIWEISAGCAEFSRLAGASALYGCCFSLSIWGVSIWAQVALLLNGTVPLQRLFLCRAFHLAIYPLLVKLILRLCPGDLQVYSTLCDRVIPMYHLPPDAAVIGFIFLCAALYKAHKTLYNKCKYRELTNQPL